MKPEDVEKGNERMVMVVYVLAQGMYDNRAMHVERTDGLNRFLEINLGLHSMNLL
jgi:hypothetical protein